MSLDLPDNPSFMLVLFYFWIGTFLLGRTDVFNFCSQSIKSDPRVKNHFIIFYLFFKKKKKKKQLLLHEIFSFTKKYNLYGLNRTPFSFTERMRFVYFHMLGISIQCYDILLK